MTNLLTLLTETLDLIDVLAQRTARYTHSNTGPPTNRSQIGQSQLRPTN
ncbi:hypothetical protein ACUTSW_05410 [Serratia sp. TSA_198.1]